MNFLERDLENIVYETLKTKDGLRNLIERGLCFLDEFKGKRTWMDSQVRIGNYGIADIVILQRISTYQVEEYTQEGSIWKYLEYGKLKATIIELKKDKVGLETILQASRYAKGIKRFLGRRGIECDIEIICIGSGVNTSSDYIYLFDTILPIGDELEVKMYNYSYDFDGISFNKEILSSYKLSNEGF